MKRELKLETGRAINPSIRIADEMLARAKEQYQEVEAQREEIMTAFVAKYGFEPDDVVQLYGKTPEGFQTYHVVHLPRWRRDQARDVWLMSMTSKTPLNWWEKFCVWLAKLPRSK